MIQLQENARTEGRTDGWKDGRKAGSAEDGQTLLYRILPTTARDPIFDLIST